MKAKLAQKMKYMVKQNNLMGLAIFSLIIFFGGIFPLRVLAAPPPPFVILETGSPNITAGDYDRDGKLERDEDCVFEVLCKNNLMSSAAAPNVEIILYSKSTYSTYVQLLDTKCVYGTLNVNTEKYPASKFKFHINKDYPAVAVDFELGVFYKDPGDSNITYTLFETFPIRFDIEDKVNISPPAPVLSAYTPDPTNNQAPTLRWNAAVGAVFYHIQIDNDADFSSPLDNKTDCAEAYYTPPSKLPEGRIYWRVSAINIYGREGGFSAADDFAVDITPPLIAITSPTDNSITNKKDIIVIYTVDGISKNKPASLIEGLNAINIEEQDSAGNKATASLKITLDTTPPNSPVLTPYLPNPTNNQSPLLDWSDVSDALNYIIQIAQNAEFNPIIKETSATNSYYAAEIKLPEGNIFWRVCSVDRVLNKSIYSNSSFKVDITPPAKIIGLTGQQEKDKVQLSWEAFIDKDGDFDRFNIYREANSITNVSVLTPLTSLRGDSRLTSYSDTTVTEGGVYYYAVTVMDKANNEDKVVAGIGPIVPGNKPPNFNLTGAPVKHIHPGEQLRFTIDIEDPNGDNITLLNSDLPSGAVLQLIPGFAKRGHAVSEFVWTPVSSDIGSRAVAINVSDGIFISKFMLIIVVE